MSSSIQHCKRYCEICIERLIHSLLGIVMLKISKQQQARLSKVLIRARQEANLTQDQLTAQLGAADAFINKIENGKRSVGFFEFYTIVKAMDQDPIKLAREIWEGDA